MSFQSKTVLYFCVLSFSTIGWALSPSRDFIKAEDFGETVNFRHQQEDVDLSSMKTELTFDDLSQKNFQELKELFETKKEFGKVFGFKDWHSSEQKLIEENSQRILLLQGSYVNNSQQKVSFVEVYWADRNSSGQYLITSDSKKLELNHFRQYLK